MDFTLDYFRRTLFSSTILALLASATMAPELSAQGTQPAPGQRKRAINRNYMYCTEPLKAPENLPCLPEYRASELKFASGFYYPRLKTGKCYVMNYLAKDPMLKVLESYRSALVQQGWTIDDAHATQKQLTAIQKKEGLYLTVTASPTLTPGYKTSFEIQYTTMGKPVNR